MRRKRRNLGNRPIKLDQLRHNLAVLLDKHTSTNAKVTVPPGVAESACIGRHAQLDVASLGAQLGDGLELRCQGINVAGNNSSTVALGIVASNGECNERGAVAVDVVFAATLQLP